MDPKRRRFEAQALPHLDAAYNLARWLARSPADADDIVQEAMLRAYRAFDAVRGGNVRPWLLAIVRNCFYTTLLSFSSRKPRWRWGLVFAAAFSGCCTWKLSRNGCGGNTEWTSSPLTRASFIG